MTNHKYTDLGEDMVQSTDWKGRHGGKDQLRQRIWALLKAHSGVKCDPVGHIPNFMEAEQAAQRLVELPLWQQSQVVKCNPDSPHQPVRLKALAAGKTLYMAVPRLARKQCFVELIAERLKAQDVPLEKAASMRGAMVHGQLVAFEEMHPIDVVVVGCVAVTVQGGRTGKGAGFADLELAMLREFGLIKPDTPIVTTVHDLQIVEPDQLPMQTHDWGLDWIATPTQVIEAENQHAKPAGLDWAAIQADQIRAIPMLRQLQGGLEKAGYSFE